MLDARLVNLGERVLFACLPLLNARLCFANGTLILPDRTREVGMGPRARAVSRGRVVNRTGSALLPPKYPPNTVWKQGFASSDHSLQDF